MSVDPTREELREITKNAEAFAKEHIVELCEELLEWQDTSILRQGKLRELTRMLKPMASFDVLALRIAEDYVKKAALEFMVEQGRTGK